MTLFPHSLLLLFFCFLSPSRSDSDTVADLSNCTRTFSCGPTISNISYPFTGGDRPDYCGLPEFKLTCKPNNITELTHNSVTYRVLHLNQTTNSLTLSRADLYDDVCPSHFVNSTLNSTFFSSGDLNTDLTLIYGCNTTIELRLRPYNLFDCRIDGVDFTDAFYIIGPVPNDPILRVIFCSVSVTVPIPRSVGLKLSVNGTSLGKALMEGFTVNYTDPYQKMCSDCNGLGGECGFDSRLGQPICICGNRPCSMLIAPAPHDNIYASAIPQGSLVQ